MSAFNTNELSIKDGSCKDVADLNHQIWSYIHQSATSGSLQNLRDFKFHSREISRLSELSFQTIMNLADSIVLHFRGTINQNEARCYLKSMTTKGNSELTQIQEFAYRYFMQTKLCTHKYGIGVARLRYGLSTQEIEFLINISETQLRYLVRNTSSGKLLLRFDPQVVNGIGVTDYFIEALSRIQLQCLNSAVEL
jgi:hypothetical protein